MILPIKIKSVINIVLLTVNFALIVFLVVNRIIIWKNQIGIDDKFLGMHFHAYRYSISRFSVYMPHFFVAAFIASIFLRNKPTIKLLLIITSILGFVFSWKAYDYFAPW
jgi:hypothetical protein